jgi:4-hydroxy-tetrahydrodipicolinate synthase
VHAGDDAFLAPLVLMGGQGAIAASANVATGRFAAMLTCGLEGRLAEGRAHAEALLPLTRALFAEPSPAVMKAVLHAEGRIPTPHVRMPLADATAGARAAAVADAATLYPRDRALTTPLSEVAQQ